MSLRFRTSCVRPWLLRLAGAATLTLVFPAGSNAQTLAAEALVDAEVWKTDDGSALLARNDGKVAPQGRIHGWVAYRPAASLELVAVGRAEGGYLQPVRGEVSLQVLELRFVPGRHAGIRAGKLISPMGTFAFRQYSNVNPLIGAPDLYPPQYPWGAMLSGIAGPVDYRFGMISLPTVNPRYSPEPGQLLRPVAGAGVRIGAGVHVGASFTRGAYLGPDVASRLPPGSSWRDYNQTVGAANARLSWGHFESHLEAAWSSYDVPTLLKPVRGFGWYDEMRVTLAPRLFAAVRLEHFRYAFIRGFPPQTWVGAETVERNAELGLGYRLNSAALVKASYRRDHWPGEPRPGAPPMPDGHALAVQFSYRINLADLLEPGY